jgi:D-glycero-alpha-D-manno-heptose-7-phosphate kinase
VFEQASPEKMMLGLGKMLDEAWETKLRLSSNISNQTIDEIYSAAKKIGVYGGKLCGAGSGGFFLFLAPSHLRDKLSELFGQGNVLKISTENKGSQVVELIN